MTTTRAVHDRSPCSWVDFISERWAAAVSPQISHIARPAALTFDGTLTVVVASRDWLEDLMPVRGDLLASLPAVVDDVPVKRIHLRVPQVGLK